MKKKKWTLGLILTFLGMIGVASLLTMKIPLPSGIEADLNAKFSPGQIKLLLLLNPTIMLLVAIIVGTLLYQTVKLSVPLIEKIVGIEEKTISLSEILKYGIIGGVLSGLLLGLVGFLFNPILPTAFKELGETLQPSLAARFLYGGIAEEILMRFGFMTFIVWLCFKIFGDLKPTIYWIGIVISSILFALGHFPIAFQVVESPTTALLAYLLIGNSLGGLIFGWLYWKKGLESAFIAHIFTHVILVFAEPMIT